MRASFTPASNPMPDVAPVTRTVFPESGPSIGASIGLRLRATGYRHSRRMPHNTSMCCLEAATVSRHYGGPTPVRAVYEVRSHRTAPNSSPSSDADRVSSVEVLENATGTLTAPPPDG